MVKTLEFKPATMTLAFMSFWIDGFFLVRLYVADLLVAPKGLHVVQKILATLCSSSKMLDLGETRFPFCTESPQDRAMLYSRGSLIPYVFRGWERFSWVHEKPCQPPLKQNVFKLNQINKKFCRTAYLQATGTLMYLKKWTQTDIEFVVDPQSQFIESSIRRCGFL